MEDRQFLAWIHRKLELYGENPNVDYMHKLRAIIRRTPENQETPNCDSSNSFIELMDRINKTVKHPLGLKPKKRMLQNRLGKIKKVIFNEPATIVFWNDGTKTVVKTSPNDKFDKEKGILWAYFLKHASGTKTKLQKEIASYCKKA